MRSWLAASSLALALACAQLGGGGKAPAEPPQLDPDLVQRGAMLFLDARVSGDGSRSCATCHPGGGSDYKVYADGAEVPPGAPGGRLTLPVRGLWQTAPYLWDGSAETLDQAVERMLAVEMRAGAPGELDRKALAAYLASLSPFDRGRIQPDGAPVEPATLSARRGSAIFVRLECDECHVPPAFAQPGLEDIGTGGKLSVPSLRGVGVAARLGHDGRWPDLESAVRANLAAQEAELNADELARLLVYLKLF
jgi:cytochrome c peroxidase